MFAAATAWRGHRRGPQLPQLSHIAPPCAPALGLKVFTALERAGQAKQVITVREGTPRPGPPPPHLLVGPEQQTLGQGPELSPHQTHAFTHRPFSQRR